MPRSSPAFEVAVRNQPRLQLLIAALVSCAATCALLAVMAHQPKFWPWFELVLLCGLLAWRMARVTPRPGHFDRGGDRLRILDPAACSYCSGLQLQTHLPADVAGSRSGDMGLVQGHAVFGQDRPMSHVGIATGLLNFFRKAPKSAGSSDWGSSTLVIVPILL